jgi:membrane dipeptidase
MTIFDGHCDVLYKMWRNRKISFQDSPELHVNLIHLSTFSRNVQCFALFVPEDVLFEHRFQACLEMIDIFYEEIIGKHDHIKHIRTKKDIDDLRNGEIGAMLTLEGCDAIGSDLTKLNTLFRLGVSSVGLTWNYANLVADGALEKRGAGLSNFGIEVVKQNNLVKAWTDVSHLSEQSFWDTIIYAEYPIASHSNVYSLCAHPRNLKDEQIEALIKCDGVIGVTFVPQFLKKEANAGIHDVIKHVEYICALGGERNLGFGSDFDGIDETVNGLENYSKFANLIEALLKLYSEQQVKQFVFNNFASHLPK